MSKEKQKTYGVCSFCGKKIQDKHHLEKKTRDGVYKLCDFECADKWKKMERRV